MDDQKKAPNVKKTGKNQDKFVLGPDLRLSLAAKSRETGAPRAEIVRRALRRYLGIESA